MQPGKGGRTIDSKGMLTIGALSRATAIPIETLRVWERRHGFPIPERKPSGHRVYSTTDVPRLRKIAEVLALGHRAAEVVGADDTILDRLLRAGGATPAGPFTPSDPTKADPGDIEEFIGAVERFDTERLTHLLLLEWARLGPVPFLEGTVCPLLRAVGEGWAAGRLEIRHEHFLSERITDVLRTVRLPFEESAEGPPIVLATLPGETHALGLQMAALTLATERRRVLYLGTEVPPDQVAALALERGACAVALSISSAGRGARMTSQLQRLRRDLPRRMPLMVGGDGARPFPGGQVVGSLSELHAWARRTAAV